MNLQIDFDNRSEAVALTYKTKILVRGAILATLAEEGCEGDFGVSVSFVDKAEIKALNKEYRGKDKVTDVLSFPLYSEEEPAVEEETTQLGDIVLCLEKAKEQAEEYGHSLEREVAYLTCHSTLHLLGYDHETSEEDEKEMTEKQTRVMQDMGISR